MANCSDVYGIITLEGEWTDEMLSALNTVKTVWASWSYNIAPAGEFSSDLISQDFIGCGRWAFKSNIYSLDRWTKEEFEGNTELKTAYELLVAEISQRGCVIELSYSENESGTQKLCDGIARLTAENGALVVESLSEQKYDYCWHEFLERDFCGELLMEELINDIFKLFQLGEAKREDCDDAVEQWVMDNTTPGANAESLNEVQLAELEALIGKPRTGGLHV